MDLDGGEIASTEEALNRMDELNQALKEGKKLDDWNVLGDLSKDVQVNNTAVEEEERTHSIDYHLTEREIELMKTDGQRAIDDSNEPTVILSATEHHDPQGAARHFHAPEQGKDLMYTTGEGDTTDPMGAACDFHTLDPKGAACDFHDYENPQGAACDFQFIPGGTGMTIQDPQGAACDFQFTPIPGGTDLTTQDTEVGNLSLTDGCRVSGDTSVSSESFSSLIRELEELENPDAIDTGKQVDEREEKLSFDFTLNKQDPDVNKNKVDRKEEKGLKRTIRDYYKCSEKKLPYLRK